MFIQNKYYKWYFNIIEYRKNNPYIDGYSEKHHVIPKSMGGSNEKKNIVNLTAREHFICHMLLFRMTEGVYKVKMAYAIRLMSNVKNEYQERYKLCARKYSILIETTKSIIGEAKRGENNPFYGKVHSIDSIIKMKAKRAEQPPPMLGRSHSKETIEKLKAANKKQFSDPSQIEIRRDKNKIWFSNPENRKNAGNGSRGKSWYYDPLTKNSIKVLPGKQPEGYIKGRILKKGA